jgi:hypothetical protein
MISSPVIRYPEHRPRHEEDRFYPVLLSTPKDIFVQFQRQVRIEDQIEMMQVEVFILDGMACASIEVINCWFSDKEKLPKYFLYPFNILKYAMRDGRSTPLTFSWNV